MKTYDKIYNFFSIIETVNFIIRKLRWPQLIMLKIFVIYIVINIISNFLIEAFSPILLQNGVKKKMYFQRSYYTV